MIAAGLGLVGISYLALIAGGMRTFDPETHRLAGFAAGLGLVGGALLVWGFFW